MANPKPPSLWQPLLRATLPGTGQAPPPGALALPEVEHLALHLPAETPETRLLNQAAALALYQRAGGHRQRKGFDLPAAAAAETREICPPGLLQIWQRSLEAGARALFRPDWRWFQRELLGHFGARGWRFPHRLLPDLLEFGSSEGRDDADLRLDLLPVLGRRGLWLAGGTATEMAVRNPWNWVYDCEARYAELGTGRGPTATALQLRRLRRDDPALARERLAAAWPNADAALRTVLLPALEVNLSLDDEAFLESCLDDKRREVRQAAQQLLGHLPGSRLVARMSARSTPLLSLKLRKGGGEELDLRLPSWPTDAAEAASWQRDGLERPSFSSPGGRALAAEAMLKLLPPAAWCEHLQVDAGRLTALVLDASDAKQLISGLLGASLQFGDARMARVLLGQPAFWGRSAAARLLPAALAQILPLAGQDQGYLGLLRGEHMPDLAEVPPEAWLARRSDLALAPDFIGHYLHALGLRLDLGLPQGLPASLLLPPFVILGAGPAELPRLLDAVSRRLLPWSTEALDQRGRDALEELSTLLRLRHDLYQDLQHPTPTTRESIS